MIVRFDIPEEYRSEADIVFELDSEGERVTLRVRDGETAEATDERWVEPLKSLWRMYTELQERPPAIDHDIDSLPRTPIDGAQ